jgi:hypothetical protein
LPKSALPSSENPRASASTEECASLEKLLEQLLRIAGAGGGVASRNRSPFSWMQMEKKMMTRIVNDLALYAVVFAVLFAVLTAGVARQRRRKLFKDLRPNKYELINIRPDKVFGGPFSETVAWFRSRTSSHIIPDDCRLAIRQMGVTVVLSSDISELVIYVELPDGRYDRCFLSGSSVWPGLTPVYKRLVQVLEHLFIQGEKLRSFDALQAACMKY